MSCSLAAAGAISLREKLFLRERERTFLFLGKQFCEKKEKDRAKERKLYVD